MSIKHVKQYYKRIRDQYAQMYFCLKEMEKEANEGFIDPERVESMENSVKILKDNYERWSYMMYLLYTPNRKDNAKKFKKRMDMDNQIPHNNTADGVIEENNKILEDLRENKNALNLLGDEGEDD